MTRHEQQIPRQDIFLKLWQKYTDPIMTHGGKRSCSDDVVKLKGRAPEIII